ncbi:glycosyltransferase [Seongchinamella sediminis]|uniref:Glycosyltransferase n=1 Tax=Seongchinamella sediminis TaxID=2283635 RepID=A0A3L7DYW2_9GAMM|nr:glycosyltransferase family 4 protein [Seongchinamella sediminis]RLQ21181.1 glycosyltransferase [Seongchinamella sediminis]
MKILHINNYHYPRGGSDRYFLDVSRGLSERGHDVRTLAPVDPRDTDTDMRVEVALRPLSTSARPTAPDIARFLYNTEARDVVRLVISTYQPDIVHLHIYYGQLTTSILSPVIESGIPIVQTLHEYKLVCPAQTMLRDQIICTDCKNGHYWNAVKHKCNRGSLLRSALSTTEQFLSEYYGARRHIDRFLTVSDFQTHQLLSMGVDRAKVIRLYNFTHEVEGPSNSAGDYFLYVGRIASGKGIGTLIQAYRLYRSSQGTSAINLLIAGEGDAEGEMRMIADKAGVSDSVTWLGRQSGDALGHLYLNCRALINPSELNETFGLNNLEAMAHGRPVICTDRGAFPEVVRDGIDGFTYKVGDVDELAARMYELTPERSLEMGAAGYGRVRNDFSKNLHLSKLEEIYADVCGRIRAEH